MLTVCLRRLCATEFEPYSHLHVLASLAHVTKHKTGRIRGFQTQLTVAFPNHLTDTDRSRLTI